MADNLFSDLIPATGQTTPRYGPPPAAPKPKDPLEVENQQLQNQKLRLDIAKKDPEADPEQAALKDTIKSLGLTELLTGVSRARKAVKGGWSTGITGRLLSNVPGTEAADFDAFLTQIEGGVILEKLNALKESSKTGASGMGALSEKEGARLAASVAAIGPNMSAEALEQSLNDIERHAKTLQAVSDGFDPTTPEVAKKYGIPPATLEDDIPADNTPRGEGPADPGQVELSAAQKASYDAFWAANPNPTPEQLEAWQLGAGVIQPGEKPLPGRAAEIIKAMKEGRGVNTSIDREAMVRAEIAAQDKARGTPDSPQEALLRQGGTYSLADEAAGIGRALSRPYDAIEGYKLGRDAERLRVEDARQQLGYAGTAIEIAGGLAAARPTAALTALTGREIVRDSARGGAAGGALAGFGSGEGFEDSIVSTGVGAAGGAALGGALGSVTSRLASRTNNSALAQAAIAENVPVPKAMITDSRSAINRLGVLEANQSTAPTVQQGLDDIAAGIEAGVQRLGRGGNAQADNATLGETVREAAKQIRTVDKQADDAAYAAAEAIDGDPVIDAVAMRTKIDTEIARLARTPGTNREAVQALRLYRADIEGPIPLSALRDMRTTLRDTINADLTSNSGQRRAARRMLSVLEGTQDDIQRGLTPEAFEAWRAADSQFRGNRQYISEAIAPFVGKDFDKLPAEAIATRIRTALNSNGRAISALHRRLSAEQSRDIAATFAESLGRRGPDEPFSTALFIQQARKLSPAARETLFGPSGATSFDNLLRLGRGLERFKSQINQSKSGRPIRASIQQYGRALLASLLTGGGAVVGGTTGGGVGLLLGASAMGVSAIRSGLSAKALMNPRTTRWLEKVARADTQEKAAESVRQLGVVIAREPALAVELQPLQRWLLDSTRVRTVSAEDGGENDNEPR